MLQYEGIKDNKQKALPIAERLSWNQILVRMNLTAISLPDQGGYFLAFLPISYPILYADVHKILAIPKA